MTLCNSTAEAMQLLPWWRVGVSRAPPDARNQPRAGQSYLPICKDTQFSIRLQIDNDDVSTHPHTISKRIKLELPD